MSANTLTITKSYRDGSPLTEAILDQIKSDIESWAGDTVDNLNQIRLDVFGSSYSYDNDGSANNSNSLLVQHTITPTATISGIDIVSTALTTGSAIDISDANALTTGILVNLVSNSADTSSRPLLQITNDNTAATGTTPLSIQQDAAQRAAYVNQMANSTGIFVDKDGTGGGVAVLVDNEGTGISFDATTAGDSVNARIIAEHATFSTDAVRIQATRTANSAFNLVACYSNSTSDLEVNLRGDGTILSDNAATTPADYAEMFECHDPEGIKPGYFVTLKKDKLVKATGKDKYILGAVSGNPAVLGDAAWSRWEGKYLKDEFNRYVLDEKGNRVLNPKYDPKKDYVPRAGRSEWAAVGMLGKLNVRTSEDITGEYVDVDDKGQAVNGTAYRVVSVLRQKSKDPEKVGYGVVRIIFRGKE